MRFNVETTLGWLYEPYPKGSEDSIKYLGRCYKLFHKRTKITALLSPTFDYLGPFDLKSGLCGVEIDGEVYQIAMDGTVEIPDEVIADIRLRWE